MNFIYCNCGRQNADKILTVFDTTYAAMQKKLKKIPPFKFKQISKTQYQSNKP